MHYQNMTHPTSAPQPVLSPVGQSAIDAYDQETGQTYLKASAARGPGPAARWVAETLGRGVFVIDAGCGDGVETQYFASQGIEVYAYDASASMVAAAKARLKGRVAVHQHRHDQLALDRKADVVLAQASLLFLPPADLEVALKNLARHLRPGGVLIASFKAGSGTKDAGDGRTFHDFEESDLQALADLAGLLPFRVVREKDLAGRPQDWVSFYLMAGPQAGQ